MPSWQFKRALKAYEVSVVCETTFTFCIDPEVDKFQPWSKRIIGNNFKVDCKLSNKNHFLIGIRVV